jgi:hypothetical protein
MRAKVVGAEQALGWFQSSHGTAGYLKPFIRQVIDHLQQVISNTATNEQPGQLTLF